MSLVVAIALLIGAVVGVITAMLLLLDFLNHPVHEGIGGLRPVAIERTLEVIDQELAIAGRDGPLPCDGRGNAL
jgi:ABC-type transporter Mla maintaining outer membrane lipid asymmetry permease subunit MlaE